MVEPARILAPIRAALAAMEPDGRYALEDATFQPAWEVYPDSEEYLSPRDLGCQVLIGGPTITNEGTVIYAGLVDIFAANYAGTRTSYLSEIPLTAYERIHGMALHVLETLAATPLPGAYIAITGAERPVPTQPRAEGQLSDWLTTQALFTITAT